jgi:predicted ATP-dependent serine protease
MIGRQEALDRLWSNKSVNSLSKVECDNLIKEIYKSLGRCKECKHYNTELGATPNDGHCKVTRDSEQALWTNIEVDDDWYCADFTASR